MQVSAVFITQRLNLHHLSISSAHHFARALYSFGGICVGQAACYTG